MARLDLYRLVDDDGAKYVVDVQSPFVDYLESRVVVPLRPRADVKPARELHPLVKFEGDTYVLMTHALASVHVRGLGRPVGSLIGYRDEIARALDILITGF